MIVPGGGWPLATFLLIIYYLFIHPIIEKINKLAAEEKRKEEEAKRLKELEEDKIDINPLTGSYTCKYSGRRYSKSGGAMWRDLDKEADMFVHVIRG